jgi:LysR family transcriptional activator of nhaA
VLTEARRIALEYADSIFRSGEELTDLLQNRAKRSRGFLRVGAASNLSRNFQLSFLRPLIKRDDVELIIHSGTLRELLAQLQTYTLDVVLSNTHLRRDAETGWHSHLLDQQSVTLVRNKSRGMKPFRFPADLRTTPILLPSSESSVRVAFDLLMDQAGIRPIIAAEVDDMAMLRLMARETNSVTLVPPVVVKDELESSEEKIRSITSPTSSIQVPFNHESWFVTTIGASSLVTLDSTVWKKLTSPLVTS